MADGLLSSALNLIDRAKQSVKSNVGLLMSNPQEFAAQKTAQYFPTKDEEMQYRAVEQAGGDVTQTPYYQKLFNLSQFQGSIKPTGLITPSESASISNALPLDDIVKNAERANVKLDVSDNNGILNISKIVVPKEQRGSGVGSSIMRQLSDYADATGARLTLSPSVDFGATSVSRLKDFYKRFGFVENKGKNKDFSTRETMYRDPQK